jgi:hypothetical protein
MTTLQKPNYFAELKKTLIGIADKVSAPLGTNFIGFYVSGS